MSSPAASTSSASSSSNGDGIDQEAVDKLMDMLGDDIPTLDAEEEDDESDVSADSQDEDDDVEDSDEEAEELANGAAHFDDEELDSDEEGVPFEDLSDDAEDVTVRQKLAVNDEVALNRILATFKLDVPFFETQTLTHTHDLAIPDASNDLERELEFYKQSLWAANHARKLFAAADKPFARPTDYFAEMVKSDEHMERVRQRLLDESAGIKASEEARRQRHLKKFGKKVQVAKQQERDKARKEMGERVKEFKKKRKADGPSRGGGGEDGFDIELDDGPTAKRARFGDARGGSARGGRGGRARGGISRTGRNAKFGRPTPDSKSNSRASTDDIFGGKRGSGSRGRGGASRGSSRGGSSRGRGGAKRLVLVCFASRLDSWNHSAWCKTSPSLLGCSISPGSDLASSLWLDGWTMASVPVPYYSAAAVSADLPPPFVSSSSLGLGPAGQPPGCERLACDAASYRIWTSPDPHSFEHRISWPSSMSAAAILSPPRSPCSPLSPAMASLARFHIAPLSLGTGTGGKAHSGGMGGTSRPTSPGLGMTLSDGGGSAPPSPRTQRFVDGVRQHTADCWARLTRQRSSMLGRDEYERREDEVMTEMPPPPLPSKRPGMHKHNRSVSFSTAKTVVIQVQSPDSAYPDVWEDSDDDETGATTSEEGHSGPITKKRGREVDVKPIARFDQ